jgi:hypothetical protein
MAFEENNSILESSVFTKSFDEEIAKFDTQKN